MVACRDLRANSDSQAAVWIFKQLNYWCHNILCKLPICCGKCSIPWVQVLKMQHLQESSQESWVYSRWRKHCYELRVWRCFQKFTYPTKRSCFVNLAHHAWIVLCLFLWWWVVIWFWKLHSFCQMVLQPIFLGLVLRTLAVSQYMISLQK